MGVLGEEMSDRRDTLDHFIKFSGTVKFWVTQYLCWFWVILSARWWGWLELPSAGYNLIVETAVLSLFATPVIAVVIIIALLVLSLAAVFGWLLYKAIPLIPTVILAYRDVRREDATQETER